MPHIQFTEYPKVPGRQYRNVCQDPVTSIVVAEVDEVLPGEVETDVVEHARVQTAAAQRAAQTPPTVPEPAPPTVEARIDALMARIAALEGRP